MAEKKNISLKILITAFVLILIISSFCYDSGTNSKNSFNVKEMSIEEGELDDLLENLSNIKIYLYDEETAKEIIQYQESIRKANDNLDYNKRDHLVLTFFNKFINYKQKELKVILEEKINTLNSIKESNKLTDKQLIKYQTCINRANSSLSNLSENDITLTKRIKEVDNMGKLILDRSWWHITLLCIWHIIILIIAIIFGIYFISEYDEIFGVLLIILELAGTLSGLGCLLHLTVLPWWQVNCAMYGIQIGALLISLLDFV